ncbi:MAG: hypothetical protein U0V87_17980 [Acidobacteriota bacterium]
MLKKSVSICLVALAAVFMIGIASPVAQAAEFTSLGVTCGPAFFPTFCVVDMSGDGNTILYRDKIWTSTGGTQQIGFPPGGGNVTALSDDGSTVVGDVAVDDGKLGFRVEAAIWLGGDQWRPLGGLPGSVPCGSSLTSAYDVSGNGSKVVGLAWVGPECSGAHGFSWTEAGGMVDLGSIVDDRSSRANVVSADGNVIAGWSDSSFGSRLGARWTDGDPPTWFTPDGGAVAAGEATGINSDGSAIVGGGYGQNSISSRAKIFEPWIWTAADGVVPLGTIKGLRGDIVDGQHYATDVSDDGRLVVGVDTLFNLGEQWAFIWIKGVGISAIQDYVRKNTDPATKAKLCSSQRGAAQPCTKWDLWNAAAVSNDGKIIVGTGRNPDGNWEAYKVTLP